MEINIKQPEMKIHNKFVFELFTEDGEKVQEAFAYNVANVARYLYYLLNNRNCLNVVKMGTGSGTPTVNDINLFTQAFYISCSAWARDTSYNYDQMSYHASATFPATTAYVGNLTEIGLAYNSSTGTLITHAMLVDAEGNPIVIQKTSTNILIVTAYVYFTLESFPAQPYNFKYATANTSAMCGAKPTIPNNNNGIPAYGNLANALLGPAGSSFPCGPCFSSFAFSPQKINTNTAFMPYSQWPAQYGYPTVSASSFPYKLTMNQRRDQNACNFGFAHSIAIIGFGNIPLPNTDILPAYNYSGITVGTGDGTTTYFYTPVNEVVSAKVFVDGIEDTTITFVQADETRTPMWNKLLRVDHLGGDAVTAPVIDVKYPEDNSTSIVRNVPMSEKSVDVPVSKAPIPCTCGGVYSSTSHPGQSPVYYDSNGITLDHLRTGLHAYDTHSTPSVQYIPVYLDYSDDGDTWTNMLQATAAGTAYFTRTTAKYWRLRGGYLNLDTSSGYFCTQASTRDLVSTSPYLVNIDPCAILAGDTQVFDFGTIGITFNTPPASGAEITMDAVLNLPYKNTDIVSVLNVEVQVPDPRT